MKQHRRETLAGKGITGAQARSLEGALALIGDGRGAAGFHDPMMKAAWLYARRTRPEDRDIGALKEMLRRAAWEAPKRPGRALEIDRYCGDAWLDEQIQGAFDKVTVERSGLHETDPGYPLPTKTVEEVREWMEKQVDDFRRRTVGRAIPVPEER